MVVATDAYVAEDGAGLVSIDYDVLPAASDCRAALAADAPPVHSGAQSNLCAAFSSSYGDVDAAFARATHVVKDDFWTHRGCGLSMECRGCIADYDPSDDRYGVEFDAKRSCRSPYPGRIARARAGLRPRRCARRRWRLRTEAGVFIPKRPRSPLPP